MKFAISPKVFEVMPTACFGVVAVKGIDNTKKVAEIEGFLADSIAKCERDLENAKVKELPEIVCYREAFRKLSVNPNKFMCSIEALMSRIAKKKGMPFINAAVDLGNAVSIKYHMPIGAHDMKTVEDTLSVRFSEEGDTFVAFGETEQEKPDANELLYVAGNQVRTRRWIWRQSEIGKITETTTDICFPIDGFTDVNLDQVLAARDELVYCIQKYFGCEATVGLLDKDNLVFEA